MAFRKKGFQTVEENIEEMNEEIRSHRKTIARRIICLVGVLIVLFVAAELYLALRTFSSYTVNSSVDRRDSEAVLFTNFGNNILKYSNDGAVYMDGENSQIWNQSYEMTNPTVAKSDDYVAIYDRGGLDVYILSKKEAVKHLEMSSGISSLSVSNQGTVAVLMKSQDAAVVGLYNKSGDKLASGEYYEENGKFPVDIALSYDGKKMAISSVDVSEGRLISTVSFYNFGSVGKNEINNEVGEFVYEDMIIPEIEYVSNDKMIALSDAKVLIFDGSEKPDLSAEIVPESEPTSVFYNGTYVGIVTENQGEDEGYHICLYNSRGKSAMDADTKINYTDVYFLENGEVCVTDGTNIEIYTTHSIRKFHYEFDTTLIRALSQGHGTEYIFVFEDSTQEVRLR